MKEKAKVKSVISITDELVKINCPQLALIEADDSSIFICKGTYIKALELFAMAIIKISETTDLPTEEIHHDIGVALGIYEEDKTEGEHTNVQV